MTTGILTRQTPAGIVDMVAVARFASGAVVTLTEQERRVAIHVMAAAGHSISRIAALCHVHDKKIRAELGNPPPVDTFGQPFTLNL